ncbi:amidohydrolase [Aeribacillus composti]|uniref:amidohydrolase n=1 Tax=Aeribacillus composti TaxID=1868734 RepID=UPI00406A2D98
MEKADMILSSNYVFTGLENTPKKASIAIKGNKIMAIGTKEEAKSFAGKHTAIYDFDQELILPGFHDFHMHLMMGIIFQKESVQLYNARSSEEVAEMVAKYAETRPDAEWIFGIGWDHTNWKNKQLPHKSILDMYISDRPVLLFNTEVHYAWINSKAIEIVQLTKDTPDPDYGEIGKDSDGELNGLLFEHAIGFVSETVFNFSKEKRAELFQELLNKLAKYGITSVHDLFAAKIAPNQLDDLKVYSDFDKKGLLTARIHFSPELKMDLSEAKQLKNKYQSSKLRMTGLKQFIDGVVTGHTAYLLYSYKDRPDTKGGTTLPPEKIKQLVKQADKEGFQIRFHAIGNGAVRLALDAFEEARKENEIRDFRHVIEHVEVLHPDDVKRFAELGIIASFQPYHIALMEQEAYTTRVGENQKPLFFPINTISESGAVIAFGTDFPVVSLNPMLGIYNAVARKDLKGKQWGENESISLSEALKNYTSTPAYGSFRENELGTLEPGKLADIVVLDKNLFDISIEDIPSTEVKMTIMDGKVVYTNEKVS